MLKLQTPVTDEKCKVGISYNDKIMMLGSCFSDSIGKHLIDYGFDVCVNPFGTLYNPISILNSLRRLAAREDGCGSDGASGFGAGDAQSGEAAKGTGIWFGEKDCVQIGAGDQRWCSFSHHTSFARESRDEFIADANKALKAARDYFAECDKIIITLGTSWCFRHTGSRQIVSNCLKHPASEFVRERLSSTEVYEALREIASLCRAIETQTDDTAGSGQVAGSNHVANSGQVAGSGHVAEGNQVASGNQAAGRRIKPKQLILTVSPIRHFKDGAHGNQISKSALLLGIDDFLCSCPADLSMDPYYIADYFPSYEILMDELRDYRFYAEDMCHPSSQTVAYIRDRFLSWALPDSEKPLLEENIRASKRQKHISPQA